MNDIIKNIVQKYAFNFGHNVLNNTIIKKYIMLQIKHELNVLQWIPPIKVLVEFRITKIKKNRGNWFKNKNIKNIIVNLVKSPKITCNE